MLFLCYPWKKSSSTFDISLWRRTSRNCWKSMRCWEVRKTLWMPQMSSSRRVASSSLQQETPLPWRDTSSWWGQNEGLPYSPWALLERCLSFWSTLPSALSVQQHAVLLRAEVQPGWTEVYSPHTHRHWRYGGASHYQWGLPTHIPGVWKGEDTRATGQVRMTGNLSLHAVQAKNSWV